MATFMSRVDTGHRDMIHDAQMDFFGTRLATCSSDHVIKIFDVKPTGQNFLTAELTGHEGPVWQVTWAHPSFESVLASCSYDHKVIVWKELAGKWQSIYEYTHHEASVNSVCWASHHYGLLLACGSADTSISFLHCRDDNSWEARRVTGAHEQGCNAVCWCPSLVAGSLVEPTPFDVNPKRLVSCGNDKLVKIWREAAEGWTVERQLAAHTDWVRDVAWAPAVGCAHHTIASCGQDKRVYIWRCANLDEGQWQSTLLPPFDDVIWHVSWSLCGTILAVSGGDNKISLWKENLDGEWVCISDKEETHSHEKSR